MLFPPTFKINGQYFIKLGLRGTSEKLAALITAHHIAVGDLRNVVVDLQEADMDGNTIITLLEGMEVLEDCHLILLEKDGNIIDVEYGERVPLPDER